jgi:hypothetical protein
MTYDNTWVPVVYNVLTAAQLQQMVDNMTYVKTNSDYVWVRNPGQFIPPPLNEGIHADSPGAMTANRIYVAKICLPVGLKVSGFIQGSNTATAGVYGAGLYTTAGAVVVKGVSGSVANAVIHAVPASAVEVPAGEYYMAAACSAAGVFRNSYKTFDATLWGYRDNYDVIFGYTSTTATVGVLPDAIAVGGSLTAITGNTGPFANWIIEYTTI